MMAQPDRPAGRRGRFENHEVHPDPGPREWLPIRQPSAGDQPPGRLAQMGALAPVERFLDQAVVAPGSPPDLDEDDRPGWTGVQGDDVDLLAADPEVGGQDRPASVDKAGRRRVARRDRRGAGPRSGFRDGGPGCSGASGESVPTRSSATYRGTLGGARMHRAHRSRPTVPSAVARSGGSVPYSPWRSSPTRTTEHATAQRQAGSRSPLPVRVCPPFLSCLWRPSPTVVVPHARRSGSEEARHCEW